MKDRYVLWIRHCESCANVAFKGQIDIMSKFRQPLCTMKGVKQAHTFGEQLYKHTNNIVDKYDLKGVSFYSSYLPRAVETVKLISSGYVKRKTKRKINRLPFISEHVRFYDKKSGSQSMTSIYKSNCYANTINKIIPQGLDINITNLMKNIMTSILCKDIGNSGDLDKCTIKSSKNDYANFLQHVLPKLPSNRLIVIVSHGGYIKNEVLKSLIPNQSDLHNLESFLVKYTRKGNDFNPKYIKNKYVAKCNKEVIKITSKINMNDLSNIGLSNEYIKYFNCKYYYHDKHPILGTSRKTSIEKYC